MVGEDLSSVSHAFTASALTHCGYLNKNSPPRPIGSGTIRVCGFIGEGVSPEFGL